MSPPPQLERGERGGGERVTRLDRKTREETVKRNQMTALRFPTGADIRHPRPPFGGEERERGRERKRKRERGRETEMEREGGREKVRERERERDGEREEEREGETERE